MSANERQDWSPPAIELAEEGDFSLGKLRVKPSSREALADGQVETLEPRVMQVLVALARRRGEVVSRDQLIGLCWGGRTVSEDALNRSMTKLRRLSSASTFTLETIPRIGYRLTAGPPPEAVSPVEPAPSPQSEHPKEAVAAAQAPTPPKWRRYLRRTLLGLAVFVVAGIGFGMWQSAQIVSIMSRPYFAVLPFDVRSSDPEAARLAEDIATTIASQLSAQGYPVVSPTVSFRYRGERKGAAAAELEPRYIIDGSVLREDGRWHISTRIDWAPQPVTVWSQDFAIDARETEALPEYVATALAGLFNPGARSLPPGSPEVTAGLLRIQSRWRAGDDQGALVATRELMRLAPGNAVVGGNYAYAAGAAIDLVPESERAPLIAQARRVQGTGAVGRYMLIPPVNWSAREQVLRAGLKAPYADTSGIRRLLATNLANSGRVNEALSMSGEALTIHRLSSNNVTNHAGILDTLGRTTEADTMLARAERLWPALEFVERLRFSTAIARRDAQGAAALLQDPAIVQVIDPPAERHPLRAIARALETRATADIAEVERECAEPAKLARERGRLCLQALVALDRIDTFFAVAPAYFPELRGTTPEQRDARWLAEPRAITHVRALFRKDMRAVRADERFIPIVERLGLLDYWRETGKWPDFCESEPTSVCARMREMKR